MSCRLLFSFVFSVSSFLSHFFQCILSLLLSQSRCFPSTLSPPPHSRILGSPLLPSNRDNPGARTCLGRAPAGPRQGTGSDVAGGRCPRGPLTSLPQRSPAKPKNGNQGGKHIGDPAVKAERCECAACFAFLGSEGPNIACRAG